MYGIRFGVEIEATGKSPGRFISFLETMYPSEVEVVRASFEAPIRFPYFRLRGPSAVNFTHAQRAFFFLRDPRMTFAVKRDTSVDGPSSEVVSPPMTKEGLPFLKDVIQKMKAGGLRGHTSAGLHVHVSPVDGQLYENGSEELWARTLHRNWRVLMPRIKKVWKPHKRRRGHCEPEFAYRDMRSKYQGFNTSHRQLGTIEYRLFNSVLDFRWVCRAVRLACGLTRLGLEGVLIPEIEHGQSMEVTVKRLLSERGFND